MIEDTVDLLFPIIPSSSGLSWVMFIISGARLTLHNDLISDWAIFTARDKLEGS
jgi:hypothetical protein